MRAMMMGSRELRNVPADFIEQCPIGGTWGGFQMPRALWPAPCPLCAPASGSSYMGGGGDGLTPEARAIDQTFYPHQIGHGDRAEQLAWHDKLGQAEVDHLLAEGRLGTYLGQSLPTRELSDGTRWGAHQWAPLPRSAADVNAENRRGGFGGHDGINRGILVRFRCAQLGIEMLCPRCDGEGTVFASDADREAYEAWEPTEPPTGDHIVLWQTVSEGGPCSPAFPDSHQGRRDLARWLAQHDDSIHRDLTEADWLRLMGADSFVTDVGTGELHTTGGAS